MSITSEKRHEVVRSLLPDRAENLLDVGCAVLSSGYPYAAKADRIVGVDWNLRVVGALPTHMEGRSGDFVSMDLGGERFGAVVCSDVFEHVQVEREADFARRLVSSLAPGGVLVLSVPHAGPFAWLDPYHVKPALQRAGRRLGRRTPLHNGSCDVRKGHRHYGVDEIAARFEPLAVEAVVRWGKIADPLHSWADSARRKLGAMPGLGLLEAWVRREYAADPGDDAFNCAIRFRAPA